MADTLDILTLVEGKSALNIPSTDNQYDTELAQVITAASRIVDDVAGPVVQRTITNEPHNGGAVFVALDNAPVVSVTSVTEYTGSSSSVLTAETTPGLAGAGYLLADDVLWRRSSGYDRWWATGRANVLVTYVAGRYANTAAVDSLFKEATAVALVHLWQHRGAGSGAAVAGGEGPMFGAVPFSSDVLRKKLKALVGREARLPGFG